MVVNARLFDSQIIFNVRISYPQVNKLRGRYLNDERK